MNKKSTIHIHNNELLLGSFYTFTDNIVESISDAITNGFYSVVLELGNNNSRFRKKIPFNQLEEAFKLIEHFPLKVFSITPKNYNLCGSFKVLAFNGNIDQDTKTNMMIDELKLELDYMATLGDDGGIILQSGKYRNKKDGLDAMINSLYNLNIQPKQKIFLENGVEKDGDVCVSFDDLMYISKCEEMGIMLNLANLEINGFYDFEKQSVKTVFNDVGKLKIVGVILEKDFSGDVKELIKICKENGYVLLVRDFKKTKNIQQSFMY